MKFFVLTVSLLFSGCLFAINGNRIVEIGKKEVIPLSQYTLHYASESQKLNLESDTIPWRINPEGSNFGVTDKIHWLKYLINNNEKDTLSRVIFIPYHHINQINIYQDLNDTIQLIQQTGTSYPYDNKSFNSRGYTIKIELYPGLNKVFIKLQHKFLPLRGTVYLLTEAKTNDTLHANNSTIWFWRGIFMFALVVSLVLYLSTKINLFLHYFLLNTGVALFIGMELGDFFLFFSQDPYNFIIDIKHLGNIMVVLFFPLFLNELTPISKHKPLLWKLMLYGIALMFVLWFACLIPVLKNSFLLLITTNYFIIYTSIVFVLQLYFLALSTVKKQRNALVLLITYFFYIAAVTINVILPNIGVKNENLLVYNTLMYGSIFEIFTFMILMGKETLSIYIERSRLLEKDKKHQTEIIRAMVNSQENERNKVGRELHDMIGANISVIRQHIDKANKGLINVIDNTIESVRRLSHGLVTPLIKEGDFEDEIKELCLVFTTEKVKVTPYFHNYNNHLIPQFATHFYRIVQELLQNMAKHSSATRVMIQFLVNEDNKLSFIYEENGKGFNFSDVKKKGMGIQNIENRVSIMEGKITFETNTNSNGYTVFIAL